MKRQQKPLLPPIPNSVPKPSILDEVLQNPYRLCTAEEIATCIGRSVNFVLAVKNAGAPFPGGHTRPEWVIDWLLKNPKFSVKEHNRKLKPFTVVRGSESA